MVLPENVEGFQNGAGVGGAARTGGAVPVADVPQSGRDDAVSRAAVSQVASADLAAGPHSSRANPDPLDGRADAPSAFSSQQPPALCALVTGATGGIGRELCAQLARECGTLALVGRDRGKLEELAKDLAERFDVDTHVFVVDFARPGEVDALASQVQAANLQVETLVNNAGFGYDAPFAESGLERQRALVQTNDMALMELCHAFAPDMAERGHGGILNVASVAGFVPGPYMSTYYASKAFVQSFSSALHMELRPYGVHVTALCPGPVRTPFWDNADAGGTALARMTISAPRVARAAIRALGCNRLLCCPGVLAKVIVFGSRLVPRTWAAAAASALQKPGK